MPTICILAGGAGTRLGDIANHVPKPLVPVCGRPFLAHVLDDLARQGADHVVISIGHLEHLFEPALGDGSEFGLRISYVSDGPAPAGTAGAVRRCLPLLGERFLVMYGDTFLEVDAREVATAHESSGLPAVMCVLENNGAGEPSNCVVRDGRVLEYDKASPPAGSRWIDYGLLCFSRDAILADTGSDLGGVQARLAREGSLGAFPVERPYHEIGTPEALHATARWFEERLLRRSV